MIQPMEINEKRSITMKKNWENPRWNEEERNRKISKKLKGRVRSREHSLAISNSKKGKPSWNKGITGYSTSMKGRKKSERWKNKIRETMLNEGTSKGERNGRWMGGKSFEPYSLEWTSELRTIIRKRDGFQCQICLKNGFCVHHIDYNKKNCNNNNLITLCRKCHPKTNHNREAWIKYFDQLIESRKKIIT